MYAQHSRGQGQGPNRWIPSDTTVEYDEAEKRSSSAETPSAGSRHPATCEVEYSERQLQFVMALDEYKRRNGRPFPTCCEVLAVLESLGYRQVAEPTGLPQYNKGSNGTPPAGPRSVPRADTLPVEHRRPKNQPVEIVLAPELAHSYASGERTVAQIAETLQCSRGRAWDMLLKAGVAPRRNALSPWMGPAEENLLLRRDLPSDGPVK